MDSRQNWLKVDFIEPRPTSENLVNFDEISYSAGGRVWYPLKD